MPRFAKPADPRLGRAALYIRMSTDHQQYCTANQRAAIGLYPSLQRVCAGQALSEPRRRGRRAPSPPSEPPHY